MEFVQPFATVICKALFNYHLQKGYYITRSLFNPWPLSFAKQG